MEKTTPTLVILSYTLVSSEYIMPTWFTEEKACWTTNLEELSFCGCGGFNMMVLDLSIGKILDSIPFVFHHWHLKAHSDLLIL
jgi:hypothetical protein